MESVTQDGEQILELLVFAMCYLVDGDVCILLTLETLLELLVFSLVV